MTPLNTPGPAAPTGLAREEAPAVGHRSMSTPRLPPSSSSPLSPYFSSSSSFPSHPSGPLGRRTRGAHSDQPSRAHGLRHAEPAQRRPHRSGRAAGAAPPRGRTAPPPPARRLRLRATLVIPPQPRRLRPRAALAVPPQPQRLRLAGEMADPPRGDGGIASH